MDRTQLIHDLLGKTVTVNVDRPIGYVHEDTTYPVNYGYIPGITAGDGEEQDAYILGIHEPVTTFKGTVIGAVCRKNDVEDKLIVAPEGILFHQGEIAQAVHFQEQYFDTYIICLLRKSCGVLPWRHNGEELEFLLVFESFSQCWSLPKGHMEADETEPETALRELLEETGLHGALDESKRAVLEYPISQVATKQVVIFPAEVSGTPRLRPGETERLRWVKASALKDFLFPDTCEAIAKLL